MSHIDFATPKEAEQAFYDAFARADLHAMMAVWADLENVVCIHPLGARLVGPHEVEAGWRELFSGGPRLHFELSQAQYTQDALLAVHTVQENIRVAGERELRPPVVATNIYQLTDRGWRMVLHHASPAARLMEAAHGGVLH